MESTAVQVCARKSTESASGSKIVDENRGDMENFLVTQDLRVEGSAEHSRCTCVDRPSRSHHEQFQTQGFLRIEPNNTAAQKCASRILNLHLDKKS